MLKIKSFDTELICEIITFLKNNTALQIIIPSLNYGKTYKTKLLNDRERLLFELLAVQTELERIESE